MTEKKDLVEQAIDKARPIIANLSFGAIMGFCSGMALKKVGKALAFVVGLGFIGLQSAAHFGYIEIDWGKIADSAKKSADKNGDGKLDVEDVKEYWKILKNLLTNKIPAAGGFSLGFLYGVKSG